MIELYNILNPSKFFHIFFINNDWILDDRIIFNPSKFFHSKFSMEIIEDGFIFSDDSNLVDVDAVHHYLSTQSYWAKEIPLEIVKRSIQNSLCFGVYKDGKQAGFARWVTDRATFAYLCDVYVAEEFRGLGLSKKLMSLMMFHPDLQGLRTYTLGTLDAHGLYEQFGFKLSAFPERRMEIIVKDIYQRGKI